MTELASQAGFGKLLVDLLLLNILLYVFVIHNINIAFLCMYVDIKASASMSNTLCLNIFFLVGTGCFTIFSEI